MLALLAPAVVTTAWYDPLRDEGKAYAEALAKAGVAVKYHPGEGLIHGYFGLVDASEVARAEALRRNRTVVLCRSDNLTDCASGDVWTGWLVFVDADNDGVVDSGEEILKTGTIDAPLVHYRRGGMSGAAVIAPP